MNDDLSKNRLGRGLAALLGDVGAESAAEKRLRSQRRVPIEFLRPNPMNPRVTFHEADLEELAQSIRERDIIQPIVVRGVPGVPDAFEIIAGERRWRGAQRAGLHDVPVVIIEADDKQALELAIIENVQRADLNVTRCCTCTTARTSSMASPLAPSGWSMKRRSAWPGRG